MNILSIHASPGGKRTMRAPLGRVGSRMSDMARPRQRAPRESECGVGGRSDWSTCRWHSVVVFTERGFFVVVAAAWATNVLDCLEEREAHLGPSEILSAVVSEVMRK